MLGSLLSVITSMLVEHGTGMLLHTAVTTVNMQLTMLKSAHGRVHVLSGT